MHYVIKNRDNNMYVARPGSRSSYTNKLELARVFSKRENAQSECCPDNEHPISIESLLPPILQGD